ncbi:hypothetical protein EYR40_002268 [Pleurotus pulmonarius]|nr:hypothetical protein EYR40_002268 [Pleurotus pulmonarius]
MSKPLVLIVGATGYTGRAIAKTILEEGKFRLAILVRAQSINKPIVKELVAAGADLRVGDTSDPPEKLEEHLAGVETLICTVLVWIADQKPLFVAAKKVGVTRVVPSDFGPVAPKGAMWMNDIVRSTGYMSRVIIVLIPIKKIDIHEYIKELGLPYTFIYVGWWLTFMWPTPHSEKNTLDTPKFYAGSKDQKLIYSTFPSIGKLVARIIADPRTINQTVVAHDGEITLGETWAIGEKVTGEDFSDYYKASEADLDVASRQSVNRMKKTTADYYRSLYIRGDNTIAKAEAAVREASVNKPAIQELTKAGAEVVVGDISESPERLESYLKGVDVLISTVLITVDQKPLILAANNAGVGRVVPSDFGPTAPEGIMAMHDLKLEIREYIKKLGLPHTFIEDGWWLLWMFPPLHAARNTITSLKAYSGDRSRKLIYSTLPTIGKMVARIIVDPRTLNQTVVAHDGEISIDEAWKVAETVTGEDFSDYPKISDEEIERGRQQTENWAKRAVADYHRSLFIRGDNTLAKAEALGRLDSRKLYDDVAYPDVEEEARKHYASGFVLEYVLPDEVLLDVFKTDA